MRKKLKKQPINMSKKETNNFLRKSWKECEVKDKWNAIAKKDKERYNAELSKWEEYKRERETSIKISCTVKKIFN